ncbi:MAG: hypothetical protein WD078_15685 [Woeseia sp.]
MNSKELDQEFRKAFADLLGDPSSYRESELDHRRLQIWDFGYIGLAQFSSLPMSRRVACTYCDIYSLFPHLFLEERANDPLWQVDLPDSMKERLISESDSWGIWFVACQPNLTRKDLQRLLKKCDSLRKRPDADIKRTSFDYREEKTVVDIELQIIRHANVTDEILARLSRASSKDIRWEVAAHRSCPLMSLQRLALDSSSDLRYRVARNPNCDQMLLRQLSRDEKDVVVAGVAQNVNATPSLLEEIISRGGPNAKAAASENPNLSLALMAKIANGKDEKIKKSLAQNPNSPAKVLRTLLASDDRYVIGSVLRNKNCPIEVLSEYATNDSAYFRLKIVHNERTPAEVVRLIAMNLSEKAEIDHYIYLGSDENDLISAIAGNAHCTAEIIRTLPERKNFMHLGWHNHLFGPRGISYASSEVLRELAESSSEWVREKVFGDPGCPRDLLETAASNQSEGIRHAALKNPCCPSSVIDAPELGDSLDWLATNARAKEILMLLGDIEDEEVRRKARANCYHPNFLESILFEPEKSAWFHIQLRKEVERDPTLEKAIREQDILYPAKNTLRATHSKSVVARVMARAHPMQTPTNLARGVGSEYWLQRMAAARNRKTPRSALEKLASDKHSLVSTQAKATLESRRDTLD